jgi:flagellar export protein FliJ
MIQNRVAHLDVMLHARQREETEAMQSLAAARGEVRNVEGKIGQLEEAMAAHMAAARRQVLEGRRPALRTDWNAVAEIAAAVENRSRLLAEATEVMKQRRSALLEAMKRRKAAGRLRERVLAREALRRRRMDVKELDATPAAYAAATSAWNL